MKVNPCGSFEYRKGALHVEGVPLRGLAAQFGTPVYIYSASQIKKNVYRFQQAFGEMSHQLCYALKANSNLHLLQLLAAQGCGADVVSGGELELALRANIPPSRIVFAGVGKSESEISSALRHDVLLLNVESRQELSVVESAAQSAGRRARVALRVNPDVAAGTHPYISTGEKQHKFGFAFADAIPNFLFAAKLEHVDPVGIHIHLGSQITRTSAYKKALEKALQLMSELKRKNIHIQFIDLGGGFGVDENGELAVDLPRLAEAVRRRLKGSGVRLVLEPGRSIMANAGLLLTKVLYLKKSGDRVFVIVDAGMNDFIRPALYQAVHAILPLEKSNRKKIYANIVGPVCESADFLGLSRTLDQPRPGDILAVFNAGAYGFSMSSNYNSRPRAAEVLVIDGHVNLIRRRETFDDLLTTQL